MSNFESGIVSEEEAKKRLCPFTFSVPEQQGPNGGIREAGPWNCVTRACLAWRREWHPTEEIRAEREYTRIGTRLEPEGGYCARLRP